MVKCTQLYFNHFVLSFQSRKIGSYNMRNLQKIERWDQCWYRGPITDIRNYFCTCVLISLLRKLVKIVHKLLYVVDEALCYLALKSKNNILRMAHSIFFQDVRFVWQISRWPRGNKYCQVSNYLLCLGQTQLPSLLILTPLIL